MSDILSTELNACLRRYEHYDQLGCQFHTRTHMIFSQTQNAANEGEVDSARRYYYWAMVSLSFSLIWFFGILCIEVIALCIVIFFGS